MCIKDRKLAMNNHFYFIYGLKKAVALDIVSREISLSAQNGQIFGFKFK